MPTAIWPLLSQVYKSSPSTHRVLVQELEWDGHQMPHTLQGQNSFHLFPCRGEARCKSSGSLLRLGQGSTLSGGVYFNQQSYKLRYPLSREQHSMTWTPARPVLFEQWVEKIRKCILSSPVFQFLSPFRHWGFSLWKEGTEWLPGTQKHTSALCQGCTKCTS